MDKSTPLRVAARFAVAEDVNIPDRSMRAILDNIQHPFGRPKFADLLKALNWLGGWTILPIVSLIDMAGGTDRNFKVDSRTRAEAEKVRKSYLKNYVNHLPSTPTVGTLYLTNLSEVEETIYGFTITYSAYKGAEGWKFIAPNGKQFEMLPSYLDNPRQFTREKLNSNHLDRLLKWMRAETDIQALAKAAIENKRVVNRTRDGTGTCAVCFTNIKIKDKSGEDPVIVLHGYKRPGTGAIHGNCWGMNFPPYELSPKGSEHFLGLVETWLKRSEEHHAQLQKMYEHREVIIEHFGGGVSDIHSPENPDYDEKCQGVIAKALYTLNGHRADVKFYKRMIAQWKLHPLPTEKNPSPDFTR